MKRITKEPWFGEKYIGWGLKPVTWQGWVVTLILLLIILLDARYFLNTTLFVIILIAAVIGYLVVAFLTGGKPGSKLLDERRK